MSKTRDISPYDFLQALQQEYICLEIRSKIYIHRNDKDYFIGLMNNKESKIKTLSKRNRLENIIENEEEYLKVWQTIVPKFGFPKLIYNIVNTTEKQQSFPYKGCVVEIVTHNRPEIKFGISEKVNFNEGTITISFNDGNSFTIDLDEVRRVDHLTTDEYYYYYPNNIFHCEGYGTGELLSYNIKTKIAEVNFRNEKTLSLHQDKISRIL